MTATAASALAIKIVALGKRGFSVDMIKRMISSDTGTSVDSRTISRILNEAGLGGNREALQHSTAILKSTDPEDVLRARWEKLLPGMKSKLRASMGAR